MVGPCLPGGLSFILASLGVAHILYYFIYDIYPFPFTLFYFYFFDAVLEGTKKQPQCIPTGVQTLKFAFCIAFCYFLKVIIIVFFHSITFSRIHFLLKLLFSLSNVGRSGCLWTVMLSKYFSPSQASLTVSR